MTVTSRIESYTLSNRADLCVLDCAVCGIVFAIPNAMRDRRYKDGNAFYCPNGHSMSWHEDEADRERKKAKAAKERAELAESRLTAERARRDQALAEAEHMRNVANGHKGAHQRTKNRVAKGVCPCCNRSFVDLAKHMHGQHPGFAS